MHCAKMWADQGRLSAAHVAQNKEMGDPEGRKAKCISIDGLEPPTFACLHAFVIVRRYGTNFCDALPIAKA
jgi:hypothetical protein